ncbi:glycosyltransferase family 4 protein [Patescibacteria group bacterium]|nr:glycosyltransferase family 4 protein [Patescibacteria group bacterium]MBU1673359.1 glycosyltransferase family 4 protein [Patescibacteria group bacterium]MBU1963981.1 glycosyltransferase family 4 protein [Patescibacteria group bacterium]
MKIGIDASRANQPNKTGTEWYSYNLIQKLKKIIPEDVRVVLYSKEPLQDGLENMPKNWESKVLNWPPQFLWTQIRLSLEMLKLWNRPKLLFVPAHTIPVFHPRSVLVAHDIGFERIKELYENKDIGYKSTILRKILKILVILVTFGNYGTSELDYHRWAMKFGLKEADHIITVSDFSKKEIMDHYGVPEKDITAIHNGFSPDAYFPLKEKKADILKQYKITTPYILFVGRLELKKNLPKFIIAFRKLKQNYKIPHKLVLVGSPGYRYEDIEANIFESKLKDDVIEPGYVEQDHMNELMNMADLFVLPSYYEGFGIPILEAMSAGTAVACSDIPALKEVGNKAAVYFNPDSEQDMAEKIFDLISDNAKKQELIAKGKQNIKKFSWDKCARETWKVIIKECGM